MSAAMNLRAWDALTAALERCGAFGHAPRPEYEAVARALDALDAASDGRMTSRQIDAVALLVESAIAAANSEDSTDDPS